MAVINLSKVRSAMAERRIKVSYATQVVNGEIYREPIYDLDDLGEPQDYGFDDEPRDPTLEEFELGNNYCYNVSPSEFAETAIKIADKGDTHNFSFAERPYLVRIYDTGAKQTLLKCGRQVEKSTTLGNKMIGYSCLNNHFRSLFVAPSAEQAKVFSNDRVSDVINMSPLVRAYTNTALTNAVFHKKFINYSQLRLRYAYLTADRVRGIPADLITVDEIQDILVDNLPVIEECASHSDWKLFIYSGTPKSLDNTLEHYWANYSTQNEWVVPCQHHGTPKNPSSWHWNILDEDNIGKTGLVCDACGRPIDPYHPQAQWASLQPQTDKNVEKVVFEGFRIPQLMVPWILNTEDGWAEILQKQERYGRQKFYNEVLGISYDSGTRPITRGQLKACCKENIRLGDFESYKRFAETTDVFAGIDWGTGEGSYTVISLGGYLGSNSFTIFWTHRFTGRELEPPIQMDRIMTILSQFNVRICGCDYGGGFDRNDALIRAFGPEKILKYQYNPNQKKGKVYWEPRLRRFATHRTEVMSDVFNAFIRKQISLPNWEDFYEPYGQDVLNIFSEYNERTRMIEYKHAPGSTDDAFHSILYCLLASMIKYPRPDIMAPLKDGGVDYEPRRMHD